MRSEVARGARRFQHELLVAEAGRGLGPARLIAAVWPEEGGATWSRLALGCAAFGRLRAAGSRVFSREWVGGALRDQRRHLETTGCPRSRGLTKGRGIAGLGGGTEPVGDALDWSMLKLKHSIAALKSVFNARCVDPCLPTPCLMRS
jgi:hypothetical protein